MVLFVQSDVQIERWLQIGGWRRRAVIRRGAQTLQALYVGSEANSPVTTSARRAGVKKQTRDTNHGEGQGRGPRAGRGASHEMRKAMQGVQRACNDSLTIGNG